MNNDNSKSTNFKDYFSNHAKDYQQFRPTYPDELFEFLAQLLIEKNLAWDCATGNGQAAVALSNYFKKVIATDASAEQIKNAQPKPNIEYIIAPAENVPIADHSVDLITVAQAAHWFDFDKFYAEAKRLLKPNGIIALWCYPLVNFANKNIQTILENFYNHTLKDYWPKEREYIDHHYHNLPFPFKKIHTPTFKLDLQWDRDQFIGYLNTWSAVKLYQKNLNKNPVTEGIFPELKKIWNNPQEKQNLHFEFILLVGEN